MRSPASPSISKSTQVVDGVEGIHVPDPKGDLHRLTGIPGAPLLASGMGCA